MSTEVARREVLESTPEAEAATPATAANRAGKGAVVGVFDSPAQADQAVKGLEASGFPMRPLSIVCPETDAEISTKQGRQRWTSA